MPTSSANLATAAAISHHWQVAWWKPTPVASQCENKRCDITQIEENGSCHLLRVRSKLQLATKLLSGWLVYVYMNVFVQVERTKINALHK